ncbi:TerD family protein [Fulvivirga maritima]|uniref:TerD family protein n=1 Tax=Fulvivirga maritima TaxID=2904247 RepID=UPI001F47543A|nr:TerD family protein [Fulvivirga maritima]UII25189.1 TerD family protein [Fulvivirga maritima]
MKTIALNRLNLMTMPRGNGWSPKQKLVFTAELAKMGYRLSNPAMLDEAGAGFLLDYKHLITALKQKKGGNVAYVPLFKGFPNNVPDDAIYFFKRVFGYLGNVLDLFQSGEKLENGMVIPQSLFNLDDFGADPVTQMQTKALYEKSLAANAWKKGDSHTEWIELKIIFDDELEARLEAYLQSLLYAKSSIKQELHADLITLIEYFGIDSIDSRQVVFKETKAFLLKYLWEQEQYAAIGKMVNNAVDVLRMFAALTDTDVSLADKVKFPKLSRKQRKEVLAMLEKSAGLAEAFKKYKGLWLEIGRYLHPGEYSRQFPLTAKAFDALRNGKLETFASKTEALLLSDQVEELLQHLGEKPGVFGRKVHEILRRFPKSTFEIVEAFTQIVPKMELKNLLVLRDYFNTINDAEKRVVVNKKGKIKVLDNNAFMELDAKQTGAVIEAIDNGIAEKVITKESWENKKVWIDPELMNYTVPLQQRKASDGIITVGRGSRIGADFTKVMRLFVYWKEAGMRTDLDLSVAQYDAAWNYLGHVSYTNLKGAGIVHSGDIQSAPYGAAEFVDITLQHLSAKVKYLAPQVYRYAGNTFADMDCHAGWMCRHETNGDVKTFDIKTVVNKFDLNGAGAYAVPFVVDIDNEEIVMTDLFVGGKDLHNNIEGAKTNVALLCSEVCKFTNTKPDMYTLACLNAEYRGAEMVGEPEMADVTFGVKDCTYNADDVEKVLSELI